MRIPTLPSIPLLRGIILPTIEKQEWYLTNHSLRANYEHKRSGIIYSLTLTRGNQEEVARALVHEQTPEFLEIPKGNDYFKTCLPALWDSSRAMKGLTGLTTLLKLLEEEFTQVETPAASS